MTALDDPGSAKSFLEGVRAASRRKAVIAFTLAGCTDPSMFVNLPVGEPGPAYGWVGLWNRSSDIAKGVPPHTVVAAAPVGQGKELLELVRRAHPLPHQREIEHEMASVVIATVGTGALLADVERTDDIEHLLDRWFEIATS